jgi:hypothetical protein
MGKTETISKNISKGVKKMRGGSKENSSTNNSPIASLSPLAHLLIYPPCYLHTLITLKRISVLIFHAKEAFSHE